MPVMYFLMGIILISIPYFILRIFLSKKSEKENKLRYKKSLSGSFMLMLVIVGLYLIIGYIQSTVFYSCGSPEIEKPEIENILSQ